jgi:hypothetical protein
LPTSVRADECYTIKATDRERIESVEMRHIRRITGLDRIEREREKIFGNDLNAITTK